MNRLISHKMMCRIDGGVSRTRIIWIQFMYSETCLKSETRYFENGGTKLVFSIRRDVETSRYSDCIVIGGCLNIYR